MFRVNYSHFLYLKTKALNSLVRSDPVVREYKIPGCTKKKKKAGGIKSLIFTLAPSLAVKSGEVM